MTGGQRLASEQLERMAARSAAVEILAIRPPAEPGQRLAIDVSVYCGDMPRNESGLRLRDRERLTLSIPPDFPYGYPSVWTAHRRFAGHPHVNWSRHLCLYQAPQTEWDPGAGMFGYIRRLEMWLRHAAIDELDAMGGPVHPPATYGASGPLLIPHVDAPVADGARWLGLAGLTEAFDQRVDLTAWATVDDPIDTPLVGPAILLGEPMPYEFPGKLGDLLRCVGERGVPLGEIIPLVRAALEHNGEDKSLYVLIGTPMRGTRGGVLRQHLTAWRVAPFAVDLLDLSGRVDQMQMQVERLRHVDIGDLPADLASLQASVLELFASWADRSDVIWCRIREDRPEVTVRRDIGKPSAAFAGKVVDVWGCGALGGYLAEWLVRGGVKKIVLRDSGVVTPGVLVRQPYRDEDIGHPKADVLAHRLRTFRRDCEVLAVVQDVLDGPLADDSDEEAAEYIIDATASNLVLTRLEEVWKKDPARRRTIASIAIDRRAERLLAVVVTPRHTGGPYDVVRRMKLAACGDERLLEHLDAFFPEHPAPPFQPEPGCSDATFVGSAADSAFLSAAAANYLGDMLQRDGMASASGCFLTSFGAAGDFRPRINFDFAPDHIFIDPQTGYETRVGHSAWRTLLGWMSESRRRRGHDVETGGLLFGEVNEHLRIAWVGEASGPPPDSQHSALEFICGVEGTETLNAAVAKRSRGSSHYVGMWHTHPVSAAIPSRRDLGAMSDLLTRGPAPVERLLLVILGRGETAPQVSSTVFERGEFEELRQRGFASRQLSVADIKPIQDAERSSLGITLSGGGSRAMAFHLGCLRALHDRGLLTRAEVISTVSGGSVIGAMYAYSDDPFEEFEQRVRSTLRSGLVWGLIRRTFLSRRLLQILWTKAISGVSADASFATRFVVGAVESMIPRRSKAGGLLSRRIQPPLRRWVTRTHALEQTLKDTLFDGKKMGSARRDDLNVVINACELRTGTAFRFGNRESGSWRYGTIVGNDVDVATAVAASAAFPVLLPALDRFFTFATGGEEIRKRVILTDGGVYENLGVTCMAPGRDEAFSTNVYRPRYIICCDAGPGQFDDVALPYGWMTRMQRSFETTHRQVQHGLQKQLHLWRQHGAIEGFIYAYLGQQDHRLPHLPPNLTRRDEVIHYPTDFSPMSEHDIDLLSARGEQLTRMLVEYYCPNL